MRAGIVIETWKLETFKRVLEADGYQFEKSPGPLVDTLVLMVETDAPEILKVTVEKAQKECRQ